MAHFAQLDDANIVINVTVVADSDAAKKNWAGRTVSDEAAGIAFCKALLGSDTNWVQTSYNNNFRFRYAGIGMVYDSTNDVFYDQQPYPSWTLNTSTWTWDAPVARPDDWEVVYYIWDEVSTSWIQEE